MNKLSKIDSNIIEYIELKPSKQLEELKKTISDSLDYFRTQYINLDNLIEYVQLIDDKHKTIIANGYEYVIKIHSMLAIIQITDTSQTNKFKYEECDQYLFGSSIFLNMFNDILENAFKDMAEQITNESKICELKNGVEKEIITIKNNELMKKKKNFCENSSIITFNHYINQLVLQLCKIKLILKNTNIYL